MPIDPVKPASEEPKPSLPPFIDENPNRDLVLEGADVAEDERRDAADDEFNEDPERPLGENLDEEDPAEIEAIHPFDAPEEQNP